MNLPPLPLLLAGSFMLAVCGGGLLLLSHMNATEQTAARRLAVLQPYQKTRALRQDRLQALLARLPLLDVRISFARLFGIDLTRSAEYPLRWWLVLPLAFAAARAATWIVALVVVNLPQLLPVPVLGIVFCHMVFRLFARRRRELLLQQFPEALAMVVRSLRVGQTVTQALRGVARESRQPTAAIFIRLADRIAIGLPLSDALAEMAEDSGLTEYRFFATTLLLQSQTGGTLSEALDTLAEVIRGRLTLRRRAYAMAGEARASAMVLGAMPVVTFGALMVTTPDYARVLLDDPTGRRVLGTAICMLVVGSFLMNVMIRRLLR